MVFDPNFVRDLASPPFAVMPMPALILFLRVATVSEIFRKKYQRLNPCEATHSTLDENFLKSLSVRKTTYYSTSSVQR